MILIGSRALSLRLPFLKRKPSDFDFVCTMDECNSWIDSNKEKLSISKMYPLEEHSKIIVESNSPNCNCEFEIVKPGSSNEILVDLVNKDPNKIKTDFGLVPSLNTLFTIKASHKYKNTRPDFFWKTVNDYHLMKKCKAFIPDDHQEFYKLRKQESYKNQQFPKLNVDKKDFFINGGQLKYVYEHDDIHAAIALQEKPAYQFYGKDGEEVKSDKNKFFNQCSEQIRINGCIEEACVLAIERSLVPHPGAMTPKQAWFFALMKMNFGIVSGWFRDYLYDNIWKVIDHYPENYFDKFQEALAAGRIGDFKGSTGGY